MDLFLSRPILYILADPLRLLSRGRTTCITADLHGNCDVTQVGPRYRDLRYLGEGAYGVVVEALDTTTGEKVRDLV